MKILVDTHILIWWLDNPTKIPPRIREAIREPENDVFFSAASIWEIALKIAKKQLRMPESFPAALKSAGFSELHVVSKHALAAANLPAIHGDPFDRILIAQARAEGMVFASIDQVVARYNVPLI